MEPSPHGASMESMVYGTTGSTGGDLEVKAPTKDEPEGFMENAAPYVAEFVGTFMIVFTMYCSTVCGDPMWNPTGVAFAVLVAVYSFGPISGAHLNPAVTLTLAFVLKFPWEKTFYYILTQIAGGFVGCFAAKGIFHQTMTLGPPPNTHFEWYDICFIEMIYTFTLSFVFISCVSSLRNNMPADQNHFFGLAVGFVYIAGGYPSLHITGSIFNPAATLAIGTFSQAWNWMALYILGQVGGAWLASVMYAIVRPEEFKLQYDGRLEEFEVPIRSQLFSELIGTFVIVLTAGLNLVMVSPAGPWSYGACYMCYVYALGDVSGGHFNPAVTLATMLTRRGICSIPLGQSYIFNQLLGGLGAGIVYAHYNMASSGKSWPLEPQQGYGWVEAGTAECVFTGVLAWVFLATATTTMPPSTTKTNLYFGIAVGSCITIGGFAIGNVAGWNMNPAVALGRGVSQIISLTVVDKNKDWERLLNTLWYSAFELSGGVVAAMLFFLTHQREYLKDGSGFPHIP